MNSDGTYISDIWFDDYAHIDHGWICIKLNRKWNFINTDGRLLSKHWFRRPAFFNNGLACVEIGRKWNYVDMDGKLLLDKGYDECHSFSLGIAEVGRKSPDGEMEYNFINKKGKLVSNEWFQYCSRSEGKYVKLTTKDGKTKYLDRKAFKIIDNIMK